MSSSTLLRLAARSTFFRSPSNIRQVVPRTSRSPAVGVPSAVASFSSSSKLAAEKTDVDESGDPQHGEESFEEFTARFEKEFEGVQDVFELQRNLNNAFAYDLVPSPSVIVAALKAARRVNDFPTAVRIFEGIKAKVENKGQYDQYLEELKPLREELGVPLKEDLYPEAAK